MSFFDELGLKAAEQLEQSVGAYVALASYKRLLDGPREIRGRATFGALRCAIELGEDREIRELVRAWSFERDVTLPREALGSLRASSPAALVLRLLSFGRRDLAAELARAEVARKPTAQARYVLARAAEQASGPDPDLWSALVEEAEKEGHRELHARAVARWLELVLASPRSARARREDIVARALSVDLAVATPTERLLVLRARLLAPSRFARASALSGLEDLAKSGGPAIRAHAILAVARDIDVANGRLDPIEIDRARATVRHWPDERERDLGLARLEAAVELDRLAKSGATDPKILDGAIERAQAAAPELASQAHRARSLVSGGTGAGAQPTGPITGATRLSALGLDAVVAMGRAQDGDAEAAMARAADGLVPMASVPSALWIGARMALRSTTATTRRAAAAFIEQALSRSASAPPYGFVELAKDLDRTSFPAVAKGALEEAVRRKEPGAAALYAELERQLAYLAFARGDRARALEALRRAKELFART